MNRKNIYKCLHFITFPDVSSLIFATEKLVLPSFIMANMRNETLRNVNKTYGIWKCRNFKRRSSYCYMKPSQIIAIPNLETWSPTLRFQWAKASPQWVNIQVGFSCSTEWPCWRCTSTTARRCLRPRIQRQWARRFGHGTSRNFLYCANVGLLRWKMIFQENLDSLDKSSARWHWWCNRNTR